ncbi:hypothetical protein VCRA2122O265_310041 [Vibrio crassostreae]|nr:hypothetical protein VCRA2118O239_280041 [Vibrio crassostreae]CAK2331133.1 hypothetical protein VCRA2113O217_290041 [Vibrio crassostreae]CAK2463578.1 hypothetical protein VCRA2119O243_290001 [Vibrio crassostreae]CAK2738321.1 hypothetical protein VCRA2119O242_290041 [Vibrio crassostreae]CAK2758705.1 hypothetical protein VCRA2117O235_290041 [Vibrio crassostreae]
MIKKYAKRGSSIFKFNYATKPFMKETLPFSHNLLNISNI